MVYLAHACIGVHHAVTRSSCAAGRGVRLTIVSGGRDRAERRVLLASSSQRRIRRRMARLVSPAPAGRTIPPGKDAAPCPDQLGTYAGPWGAGILRRPGGG